MLEAGYDTETLRQLAGMDDTGQSGIGTMFEKVLQELGRRRLSKTEAGHRLAMETCQDIVSGRISPYEGARKIWWEIWDADRNLDHLRVFVGLASEYEDDHTHRSEYSNDILQEARRMLENN
jgi:hypothetical protein